MDRLAGIEYRREPTGSGYVESLVRRDGPEGAPPTVGLENIECARSIQRSACCGSRSARTSSSRWRTPGRIIAGSSISCSDSQGRLVPIAHIPLGLPDLAEQELRRAGPRRSEGFWVPPFIWSRRPTGIRSPPRLRRGSGARAAVRHSPELRAHWAAPTRFGKMTGFDTRSFRTWCSAT